MLRVERNSPSAKSSSYLSVMPGTTTWRIHTGMPISRICSAKASILRFPLPVSRLCSSSSMCFMSSITRSVYFRASSIFSWWAGSYTPAEVSRQVWTPLLFARANSSARNSGCASGSPPVAVMPPDFRNSLYESYSFMSSSAVTSLPPEKSHVSGLWQYLHLSGQP